LATSSRAEIDRKHLGMQPSSQAIRKQLKRVLAHKLFTNSKRYPVLLAYIVEQTLLGNGSQLKERTIGIEAFGREPDYDVNADPVVRTTSAEVRKRLTQYYYDRAHAGELVIELQAGSYVPAFREPTASPQTPASHAEISDVSLTAELDSSADAVPPNEPERASSRIRIVLAAALLVAILVGFALGRLQPNKQTSELDRFWEPLTSTPDRITYCLGKPIDSVDRENRPPLWPLSGGLDQTDVATLARLIVPLVSKNSSFRVVSAAEVSFEQLREGPIVLIGAYDNTWTMRITQNLPFGFEFGAGGRKLIDRRSASERSWSLQGDVAHAKLTDDYAIIGRIHDTVTGQPVMIIAGILGEGTEAAGEAVSNPNYLAALLKGSSADWDRKNFEAVVQTHVIDGHPGPPLVISTTTW
jgi:hypothetical protein